MTDEEFESVIDVNLAGTFRCVRRVSKGMIRARKGRIVLVGSIVGLSGGPGQVNYSSSKAALVGMARSITRELGPRSEGRRVGEEGGSKSRARGSGEHEKK